MRLLSRQGKQTSPATSGRVASGKWRRQLQLIAYFKRFQIKTADNVNNNSYSSSNNNNNNNNNSTPRLMPIENIKNEQRRHKRVGAPKKRINCTLWQKLTIMTIKKFKNHIATKIIMHMMRIMRNANSI